MATVQQLEEGVRKAYEMGRLDDARILGEELVRMRGEAVMPETRVVADVDPSIQGVEAPAETTATGVAGAVTRGLAPVATGAAAGALLGLPFAGVGAVPGAVAGAATGAILSVVGDPVVSSINSLFGTKYTLPTDAMEDLLTRVGVAEPRTAAERIVQTTAAGAGGAGGIAALGRQVQTAAAGPVAREVGRTLAAQPVVQIAGGAGGGAAGGAAREMELGAGGEIAASLVGGIAGARAAASRPGVMARQPLPPEIAQAEREGIRLLTSDISPPRTFISKSLQAGGERVPFAGTGGLREAQQTERIEAVRNVLRDFGADDFAKLSDNVMADLATKRSADIGKYTQSKKEVINRLANKGTVPVPRALQAIDDQIADLTRRRTEGSDEAVERLQQIKTDLQNRDLFQIEAYRQDELAKIFMDDPARPMSIAARDAGEKALRAVYGPVREDMVDFIKKTGERRDVDKFVIANKRLSDTANDMRNASIKTLLLKGDVKPEVIQRLLFQGKPSEVRALYSKLTPQGRATARAAILAKAGQDATTEVAEGKIVSPDRFANNVKKMGDSVGVFFTGDDMKRVEGLTRVLNITKRASEAGVVTPTGQQLIPIVAVDVISSTFGGPMGATVAAGTVGGLARIYESAPVRNLLLQVARSKPGSKEEAALAKRLLSTIQTQAEAVKTVGRETTEVIE